MISIPQPSSSTIISDQIRLSSALVCSGVLIQGVNTGSIAWAVASGDYAGVMGAIFNSAFRLSTPAMNDLRTMSEISASSVAMTAIAASSDAMEAILDIDDITMPVFVASSTAMTAIAASSVAMGLLAASSTAMTATAASSVAMAAISMSLTAMTVIAASSVARPIFLGAAYSVGRGIDTLGACGNSTMQDLNAFSAVAISASCLRSICSSAAVATFVESALQPFALSIITALGSGAGAGFFSSMGTGAAAALVGGSGVYNWNYNANAPILCIPYSCVGSGAASNSCTAHSTCYLTGAAVSISVSNPGPTVFFPPLVSLRGILFSGSDPSFNFTISCGYHYYTAV